MTDAPRLDIDVVSDVVCPWCFIGQKRLDKALKLVPDVAVTINWRPYQLDATIPPEGTDRTRYMVAKFGSRERIDEIHATITQTGIDEGIRFDFDAITTSPNTLDAHRLIRWAAKDGNDVQNALVRRLFQMYFEQGKNIGDRDVLADAALEAGMDRAIVEALRASNADIDAVRGEIETATSMGVRGVPCFFIDARYAVMGAQEPATLADAIREIAAGKS